MSPQTNNKQFAAVHVAACRKINMVAVLPTNRAFVRILYVRSILVHVVQILAADHHLIAIFARFYVLTIKATIKVLAICQVVSEAVLQVVTLVFFEVMLELQLRKSLLVFLILLIRAQINRGHFCFVFFARELLIFKTKFLLPKTIRAKAILASNTVAQKRT